MTSVNQRLPVDIVFHPSWWNAHARITFNEDFFYHPKKRVESERKMEEVLYDRFGDLEYAMTGLTGTSGDSDFRRGKRIPERSRGAS